MIVPGASLVWKGTICRVSASLGRSSSWEGSRAVWSSAFAPSSVFTATCWATAGPPKLMDANTAIAAAIAPRDTKRDVEIIEFSGPLKGFGARQRRHSNDGALKMFHVRLITRSCADGQRRRRRLGHKAFRSDAKDRERPDRRRQRPRAILRAIGPAKAPPNHPML